MKEMQSQKPCGHNGQTQRRCDTEPQVETKEQSNADHENSARVPLLPTIWVAFLDLWVSISRDQALGKVPVAPQMADLASQDILRPPCGGVGEGWERIFNEFWDPQKICFRHFSVQNTV